MLVYENDSIKQAFFVYSVENALYSHNHLVYERVLERLENDFGCSLQDCYQYPEYLKLIIQDLCGSSYQHVLENIIDELSNFDSDKTFFRIITKLKSV